MPTQSLARETKRQPLSGESDDAVSAAYASVDRQALLALRQVNDQESREIAARAQKLRVDLERTHARVYGKSSTGLIDSVE